MTLPEPALEHIGDLTVFVAAPIEAGEVTGLNSRGKRRIIPITGGTLTGPRLLGADLDARYLIALDGPQHAGQHIFVQNRALRRGSADDIAKLVRGEPVDPAAIYFRCVPTFEVSSPALQWLSESIFVGTGARFPDRVEISLFRLA
jgi:Protein of unknown function (DUF3237)